MINLICQTRRRSAKYVENAGICTQTRPFPGDLWGFVIKEEKHRGVSVPSALNFSPRFFGKRENCQTSFFIIMAASGTRPKTTRSGQGGWQFSESFVLSRDKSLFFASCSHDVIPARLKISPAELQQKI